MTEEQFNARIDHIGRIYESAKDAVYKEMNGFNYNMKPVLDGLQELRNISCDLLQKLRDKKLK